ncbi:MAG: phosphate acetyltransferase [Bifidobacteriaceae bacterium]|nr:phosphate acetyltransferase [Bifidobacteriaceae bacterium]
MARSVYLASTDRDAVKSIVALGLVEELKRSYERVGVFRPILRHNDGTDHVLDLLKTRDTIEADRKVRIGTTYQHFHQAPRAAMEQVLTRYEAFKTLCDVVVVVGSDHTDVPGGEELTLNARMAATLGTPVILVVPTTGWTPRQVLASAELASATIKAQFAKMIGVIANRCGPEEIGSMRAQLGHLDVPTAAIPDSRIALAPTLGAVMDAVGGHLVSGDPAALGLEVLNMSIAAQEVEHVLAHIAPRSVVFFPGDRVGVLLGLAATHSDPNFPGLAGLILGSGYMPDRAVLDLARSLAGDLPIIATHKDSFSAAAASTLVRGHLDLSSQDKAEAALAAFEEGVDAHQFVEAMESFGRETLTPLAFQQSLTVQARRDPKRIVLPEGSDDRILRAAAQITALGAANITILGKPDTILARASELGIDLSKATLVDPSDDELVERFADLYAKLRAHKGMTKDKALAVMTSSETYFGTMMVHTGMADGMVSGAIHTTADTIRPAFEIIKTKPGTAVVSSVFLMAMADRVLVFGDCAVNPNPTPAQLAGIAIDSAATAAAFGVEPRVALLSYSTGTSGLGPAVEAVTEATRLARQAAPDLALDGPLQYDAAVVASVGAAKSPSSPVAGRATVLIFPDLNSGNITYKAVQRSAGAVAIGPVLQGLRKPVNDLSRGALVEDIVATIIITACQAQASAN